MFLILITSLLLADKLLMLFHTSKQVQGAGDFIQRIGYKLSPQKILYLLILGLTIFLWINLSYFSFTNQMAFIIYGIYLWIYIFYKFQKIKVYESGLIVEGYYMAWSRIKTMVIENHDRVILSCQYDTLELTSINNMKNPDHLKALYEKYKDSSPEDEKIYYDNPILDAFVTKIIRLRDKSKSN